jgi:hypothetical protein
VGDAQEQQDPGAVDGAHHLAGTVTLARENPAARPLSWRQSRATSLPDMGVDASALLVTVAPDRGGDSKEDCPQLPTTLEELVETARSCEQAGAADDPRPHP